MGLTSLPVSNMVVSCPTWQGWYKNAHLGWYRGGRCWKCPIEGEQSEFVHWVVVQTADQWYRWGFATFDNATRVITILAKTQGRGMLLYYQKLPYGMNPNVQVS